MKKATHYIYSIACCLIIFLTQQSFASQPEYSTAGFFELPNTGRTVYSMNPAWRMYKGHLEGAEQPDFNDKEWDLVSLPDGIDTFRGQRMRQLSGRGMVSKTFHSRRNMERQTTFLAFRGYYG